MGSWDQVKHHEAVSWAAFINSCSSVLSLFKMNRAWQHYLSFAKPPLWGVKEKRNENKREKEKKKSKKNNEKNIRKGKNVFSFFLHCFLGFILWGASYKWQQPREVDGGPYLPVLFFPLPAQIFSLLSWSMTPRGWLGGHLQPFKSPGKP